METGIVFVVITSISVSGALLVAWGHSPRTKDRRWLDGLRRHRAGLPMLGGGDKRPWLPSGGGSPHRSQDPDSTFCPQHYCFLVCQSATCRWGLSREPGGWGGCRGQNQVRRGLQQSRENCNKGNTVHRHSAQTHLVDSTQVLYTYTMIPTGITSTAHPHIPISVALYTSIHTFSSDSVIPLGL